ncbi:MAG TPA: nucleotidyltransferase family protein [Blastocatellia bacterium]|nr:nucleotidyltransferase family protein [Blastocatellia bacterium]
MESGEGVEPCGNTPNTPRPAIDTNCKTAQSLAMQDEHKPVDLDRVTRMLRDQLPSLAQKYHVKSLGVFGSYVRRQQSPQSDLDLLVVFDEPPGLLKFIELENFLTDLLGIRVDLVMKDSLKPMIGKQILSEVVQV